MLTAAATLASLASFGGPPAVHAQTLAFGYGPITVNSPEPQARGRWGERVATAFDINRDGFKDLWIGVPQASGVGRVYLIDGHDAASGITHVIYTIDSPEPQPNKQFGFWISNLGDVNHDSIPDVAIGTDAQDVPPHRNQGKAWVFDGQTGARLYDLNNPFPQGSDAHRARFGSRIGRAGDINNDGIPDVIVGASGNDQPAGCSDAGVVPPGCRRAQGQAFIFNGANGALLRTLDVPPEDQIPPTTCPGNCGNLGLAVQGPGDVDGDQVPDQLVDGGTISANGNEGQGRMYVYSGATGAIIRKIDDPTPQEEAIFGFQEVTPISPGDVDFDNHNDLYGEGFDQHGPAGLFQGRSWVFSGATGTVLYELQNPHPRYGGQFGWSMARDQRYQDDNSPNPDANHPVKNPLYVGNAPHDAPGADQRGETNLFVASTGTPIQTLPLPPPWNAEHGAPGDLGPNLGWSVASPGDLDHDGARDFVGGAPFTNVAPNQDQGVVIVFNSTRPGINPASEITPRCSPNCPTTAPPFDADNEEGNVPPPG